MTYYFSTGADIVGVSLQTGLITSSVAKTFQAGAMYYDMMRSTQNCYGALKVRQNNPSSLPSDLNTNDFSVTIKPNPATDYVTFQSTSPITHIEIRNLNGQVVIRSNDTNINISNLNTGVYVAKVYTRNGNVSTSKLVKQ
ncbi:MAG: T9SS type A sorting domain-containing protein [Bacteroidetes bacterium]|nr:T9SS type A sorting domain-containing protein [Bacteroidota bacterium]